MDHTLRSFEALRHFFLEKIETGGGEIYILDVVYAIGLQWTVSLAKIIAGKTVENLLDS